MTRKSPECPSTEETTKNMWFIYTNGISLSHQKNKLMPSAATWMDPETVILSELRSVPERAIPWYLSHSESEKK